MSNTLTTVTNKLIDLIQTQYTRFKDPGRIEFNKKLDYGNLGYEDVIQIIPEPSITAVNLSRNDKIINHILKLRYFKKLYKNELTILSDFAENLDSYFMSIRHQSGYWTSLETSINYYPEMPEGYEGKLEGFEMTITFIVYKT